MDPMAEKYGNLTLETAMQFVPEEGDDLIGLIRRLGERITSVRPEQERFREWCDRADKLYFAETFTRGGADLWPDQAGGGGRTHVSVNTPKVYVDVPAALQSVDPVENMLARDNTKEARTAAAQMERVYTAWKVADQYDLKFHKACTVKELYGRTAAFVYWDQDAEKGKGRTCVEMVEQPRNLWLGYQNDSYAKPEWAAYSQLLSPNAVIEEFGVDVQVRVDERSKDIVPFVTPDTAAQFSGRRPWLDFGQSMIEVWDYWYREPSYVNGKFSGMETWNVVFAGTVAVRQPTVYPEYEGMIPFLPLFNSFLPGQPSGRPALYDVEPLIREKMEMITAGSQMIASGTAGDYWQLIGAEAPLTGKIQPTRNKVVYPGAGNRIETITPFIAQFQLEQHLVRIDREKGEVSGLNDLLLGLAPAQVLSSSKAINALIANYEARLRMPRQLLYQWRKDVWDLNVKIAAKKSPAIKTIVDAGGGILDITDPSLSPRDEMETATRAANLVNAKLWSQRRGMDAVHVDDPESEQDMIREERTDATLFPADVQVMAQLMAALQSLNLAPPPGAQAQANGQLSSGQNDLRTALGGATPDNTTSSQLGGDQGETPPIPGVAPEAGGAATPFAQGPAAGADIGVAQTMIQGGQAKSRILTQQKLGRR